MRLPGIILVAGLAPLLAAAKKRGIEVAPIFMGGSPLINWAILAGEFPIGFTGRGGVVSSRLGEGSWWLC